MNPSPFATNYRTNTYRYRCTHIHTRSTMNRKQNTNLQNYIGVPHKKNSMRGLRRRNRTKVFNPPYFKSTIFVRDMVFEEIDQLKTISKICTGVVIVHTP